MNSRSSYTKCTQIVGDYKAFYEDIEKISGDSSERMCKAITGYIVSAQTTRADIVKIEDFFITTFKSNVPKAILKAIAEKKKEFLAEVVITTSEETFVNNNQPQPTVGAQYSTA